MAGHIVHVVDGDAAVRDSAAALLTLLGHEPMLWESGGQFLARANPRPGECILLDVRMSGIGGIEVLGRLTAWGIVTPVVMMTEPGERWLESEFMERGAVWLLDKPFTLGDLKRALAIAEAAAARIACQRAGIEPQRRIEG
ncbi:response regulator [Sphingomonas sp. LB-2]|uniref:response regulator transcription factor n=1 Tax=Sphingomonas caeni TaxID=2984949 RepID=UPI00222E95DE|nr:response regulator [Sphingomonas caeni]MCW3848778.1 response regulator [Sphingomonas caeni]